MYFEVGELYISRVAVAIRHSTREEDKNRSISILQNTEVKHQWRCSIC